MNYKALMAFALLAATASALTIQTWNPDFTSQQTVYNWLGQGDVYWTISNPSATDYAGIDANLLFPKDLLYEGSTQVWAYTAHPKTINNCTDVTTINLNSTQSTKQTCKPYVDQNYYWDWAPLPQAKLETSSTATKLTSTSVDVAATSLTRFKTHVSVPVGSQGEFNITTTDPKTGGTVLTTLDPYWNSSYTYKALINITNLQPYALWGNYTMRVPINHSAMITNSSCNLTNGSDLRVVYDNGVIAQEIDRWTNSTWNNDTAPTWVWFQLQANLSASENNQNNYFIYCNYSPAGNPPDNMSRVFLFGDDFIGANGSDPDTTVWDLTENGPNNATIYYDGANRSWLKLHTGAASVSTYARSHVPFVTDKNSTFLYVWGTNTGPVNTYSGAMGLNKFGYSGVFDGTLDLPRTSDIDMLTGNGNGDNFWTTTPISNFWQTANMTYEQSFYIENVTSIAHRAYKYSGGTRPLNSTCLTTGAISGSNTWASNCLWDSTAAGAIRNNYILLGAYDRTTIFFDYVFYRLYDDREPQAVMNYTDIGATGATYPKPNTTAIGHNQTLAGLPTKFYARWQTPLAFSLWKLELDNGTGTFTVDSGWQAWDSSNWTNYTYVINYTANSLIRYRFTVNDSTAQSNTSQIQSFNTTGVSIVALDEETLEQIYFNLTITNSTTSQSYSNQLLANLAPSSLPTGLTTFTVTSTNYQPRNYYYTLSGEAINLTALLLKTVSGQFVRFHAVVSGGGAVTDATVSIYRLITGFTGYQLVQQATTDASGVATTFLSPTTEYNVTAISPTYGTVSKLLITSSPDYTLTFGGTTTFQLNTSTSDVWTYHYPSVGLNSQELVQFNWTAYIFGNTFDAVALDISFDNGTSIGVNTTTSSTAQLLFNVTPDAIWSNVTVIYAYKKNGYAWVNSTYQYFISNWSTNYSINNTLNANNPGSIPANLQAAGIPLWVLSYVALLIIMTLLARIAIGSFIGGGIIAVIGVLLLWFLGWLAFSVMALAVGSGFAIWILRGVERQM